MSAALYSRLSQDDRPGEEYSSSTQKSWIYRTRQRLKDADWKWWGNMITLMSVVFVGEAARGLVVPSLFLYLAEV
jgi:hypothetical protein